MKPEETKRIYQSACRAKRVEIVQEESEKWHKVLRPFEARDVETALSAWWADTTSTQTGRPRGAFLPEPVELKPLVQAAQSKREAAAREPRDLLAWECQGQQKHTFSGFIARSKLTPSVQCRYCGARLRLIHREAA